MNVRNVNVRNAFGTMEAEVNDRFSDAGGIREADREPTRDRPAPPEPVRGGEVNGFVTGVEGTEN